MFPPLTLGGREAPPLLASKGGALRCSLLSTQKATSETMVQGRRSTSM